jgi:hypothetical protein
VHAKSRSVIPALAGAHGFFRKGVPKKIKEELQPMPPLSKITSFFSRALQNVLDLPDEEYCLIGMNIFLFKKKLLSSAETT